MNKVSEIAKKVLSFLPFLWVGFEIELEYNMNNTRGYDNSAEILKGILDTNVGHDIFKVGYDCGAIEIKFVHKMRLNDALTALYKLFVLLNKMNIERSKYPIHLFYGTEVGIHVHFSHDNNEYSRDLSYIFNNVRERIRTYEDILMRIGSRIERGGKYVNRKSCGNVYCDVLSSSDFSKSEDTSRNMIRRCNHKCTTEFRFIDCSLEIWRILSIVTFLAHFYAYCVIHKTVLRTDKSNQNIYNKGEYEYHKLHTFCNQNLGLDKENLHNICKLYNDTFFAEERVHRTRKERREALKH